VASRPDRRRPPAVPAAGSEPKTAKNRLHLDLRVSGDGTPEQKWSRVTDEVARLTAAGAVALHTFAGHHVVMADSEGNEFCIA